MIAAVAPLALAACSSGSQNAGQEIARIDIVPVESLGINLDSLRATGVVLERSVDQRPVMLSMEQLHYPDELREMGIEGRVVLRFILGTDGRPELNSVSVASADNAGFIFPARAALMSARFRPGKVRGQPVRVLVNLPFDFKIRRSLRRP